MPGLGATVGSAAGAGLVILLVLALLWPDHGLLWRWRRARQRRRRVTIEDALKHMHAWHHRGASATAESLAGALGLSMGQAVDLSVQMEAQELVRSTGEGLRLTPQGHGWALQIIRAHRLWERYLADEVGLPLKDLHSVAEHQEHRLTPSELDALEANLGYPRRDPHGDPIPAAGGDLEPHSGRSLADWPIGEPARIVHIEDEPETVFAQIIAEGLLPGSLVEVLECDERGFHLRLDGDESWLAPMVARNVFVGSPPPESGLPADAARLSTLEPGEKAKLLSLESQGLTRRRFLDLGLTPGVVIECLMPSIFGEPKAYEVRGTTIALRREQADQIWVQPDDRDRPPEGSHNHSTISRRDQ